MAIFAYIQDDINTDLLYPGKYTYLGTKPSDIKEHLLEDLDPTFKDRVKNGDIIIAGKNFGCGSSREQPNVGLKYVGIQAIIAKSFSRIFFRSATNQGLLLIELPAVVDAYKEGDFIEIDSKKGVVLLNNTQFNFPALPTEMQNILKAGGLLEYIKENLK
ncbi:MAG: 3-isopropylmalate dehydratase [Candidatus Coatesbacteria bacterium]|nr:3-isopropylmalate dehydratase [Candidatus Coatesbacteria bacterium]